MRRRAFLAMAGGLWFAGPTRVLAAPGRTRPPLEDSMYGLIGRINAVEGRRDDLAAILMNGISGMPGCLSYVVARDAEDPDSLWVTEVWESEAHHRDSLGMASVQAAIAEGRPLIAGFGERYVTEPLGGQGLEPAGGAPNG